eukprot:2996356-Pleurochrysis_carterae.AAC.1
MLSASLPNRNPKIRGVQRACGETGNTGHVGRRLGVPWLDKTWLYRAFPLRRLRLDESELNSTTALPRGTGTTSVVPGVSCARYLWQQARLRRASGGSRTQALDFCGRMRAPRRVRKCRPGERCTCVAEGEHGQRRARCPR